MAVQSQAERIYPPVTKTQACSEVEQAIAKFAATYPDADLDGDEGVKEWVRCPITRHIMSDPVIASDGNFYERTAIEAYIMHFFKENGIETQEITDVASIAVNLDPKKLKPIREKYFQNFHLTTSEQVRGLILMEISRVSDFFAKKNQQINAAVNTEQYTSTAGILQSLPEMVNSSLAVSERDEIFVKITQEKVEENNANLSYEDAEKQIKVTMKV